MIHLKNVQKRQNNCDVLFKYIIYEHVNETNIQIYNPNKTIQIVQNIKIK